MRQSREVMLYEIQTRIKDILAAKGKAMLLPDGARRRLERSPSHRGMMKALADLREWEAKVLATPEGCVIELADGPGEESDGK